MPHEQAQFDRSSASPQSAEDTQQAARRQQSSAPPPTRPPSWRRWAFLLGIVIGIVVWLGYRFAYQAIADRNGDEQLALDAVGGWWNVAGDRYLELEWEGRRATLWDYSASDTGAQSPGNWRTTSASVIVDVAGDAGSLTREFEIVGNEAELFLAPAPADRARLLDSWIADHGSDEQEPAQTGPRETAWRARGARKWPHHHPRHPHGTTLPKAALLTWANSRSGRESTR